MHFHAPIQTLTTANIDNGLCKYKYFFIPLPILQPYKLSTTMKRLLALSCLLVAFVCAFAQQKVTLQDVANGTYRPQNIYGIKPMLDGEHYTQISADRKRIVK